ncbi:autophagy-related protein 22-like protein [Phascolomyces articulosus]|uniref:Autophagy-related protein n=1 Tax=Phascolomyces articulosus TaxID=60185 RepID=A0AAD5K385_9FUNG|nr:autophagy-related protein 22-like protein [Phascolomyces articulosus]
MSLRDHFFADPFTLHSKDSNGNDLEEEDPIKATVVNQQPPATKMELWGYYLYYNGNNGFTVFSFLPNILQYLAFRSGHNPDTGGPCDIQNALTPCNVRWPSASGSVPVSSMMLYVQSISFSVQFLLFTSFGSLADYGRWNRYILLTATIIACTTQIIPVALVNDDGSNWGVMMAIFIVGLISYGTTLVFYGAAFPTLSDNLPVVRQARASANLSFKESETVVEKWRNHVSAISTTWSNIGFLILTAVLAGPGFIPWGANGMLGDAPVYNFICTAVCGGFWVINAIPYFMFQPSGRQGPPLPPGESHWTVGWKSIFQALREARKLRYLFMYIFSYFMFSDAVSTINTMITIITGEVTNFSALQSTLFGLVTAITSILGCVLFLYITKTFGVSTKTNLLIIVGLTSVIPLWGCFGISMNNFGFKTTWELWAQAAWSGLFTAPIWAWQQTMLAELTPKGKENLFFGLFGIVNKASSWIGPVVVGAISQSTSNVWMGWPFVLGLFLAATVIVLFIDVDAAKQELAEYEKSINTVGGNSIEHLQEKVDP